MMVLVVDGLDVLAAGRALVRGASFTLAAGEVLGLIGESGSGKTMTASALLRLLPDGITAQASTLKFMGHDLVTLKPQAFDRLRGPGMAMIFQDPVGAFNPAKTIGWHFQHVLRRAAVLNWRPAARALLLETGVTRPEVLVQHPHQLSGGMLQRALIALVLAQQPTLIVADEPTTNLDALVGRQIIALFREIRARRQVSFLYITHDLEVARQFCTRVAVMYAGQIIEQGGITDILDHPRHPYTVGLVAAATELATTPHRLREMPGAPAGHDAGPGCAFASRCPQVQPRCRDADPGMRPQPDGSDVRCVLYDAA